MMSPGRDQQDQPPDPDAGFTVRGAGKATFTRPADYLFTALLTTVIGVGFAGYIGWNAITDPGFREKLWHPAALMLVVLFVAPMAVGGWAFRRFGRWRRARADYAEATGSPYRTILTESTRR